MLDADTQVDFISMFAPDSQQLPISGRHEIAPLENVKFVPAIPPMDLARTALEPFRQKALDMEDNALKLAINSLSTQTQAVSLAGDIKKTIKKIEEARKDYVGPFNAHIKEVNALAGEIRFPLEQAEKELKKKLNTFAAQLELERRKAEEEARQRAMAEQERLNKEAAEAGVDAPLVAEVVEPEDSTTVKTANGTAFMQSRWTFEIEDLAKVPGEYLILDEKKVRAAIKAGIREIAGLKIFEQKNVAIRS